MTKLPGIVYEQQPQVWRLEAANASSISTGAPKRVSSMLASWRQPIGEPVVSYEPVPVPETATLTDGW
jgi:hypothetical protein